MLIGAHSIVYSTNPDADRAFLRDVLALPAVDVGDGWMILGLPPAEVAVHPSNKNDVHGLYPMSDDVEAFVAEMKTHDVACTPVQSRGWGLLTQMTLPGGGRLGIYQPLHARPEADAGGKGGEEARRPRNEETRGESWQKDREEGGKALTPGA